MIKQLLSITVLLSSLLCFSQTTEIDSLTLEIAYQKQDSSKVKTSIALIDALLSQNETQKALAYIDQTEKLASQLNYRKGLADINYYKALIYAGRNDYFNAIDGLNSAANIYQQIGDTLGVARVNNQIGLIEIKRGNYKVGLSHALSAIEVFESNNLRKELGLAYSNLGEAYFQTRQTEKALEFNLKALQINEALQDSEGIKMTSKNLAALYSERKEHRKAIEYYEKLLGLIDKDEEKALRGEILPRIGAEYLEFNDYDKAGDYLVEGLNYNRKSDNDEGLLISLNALAELNMIRDRKSRLAPRQLEEAEELALRLDNKEQLLKNYRLRKELDSMNDRFENAFKWQSRYFNLKSELDTARTNAAVSEIDSVDTIEPIDINQPENVVKSTEPEDEQTLKRLRIISYILIAAFLAVSTILLLIYLKRKNTVSYTKELEAKNKQIEKKNLDYAEQTKRLEDINNVKDRLFSIVSHDLKDSISSIKGFIDLLKEDSISREEFYNLVPELSENADNASSLLYNLLNWSKSQMQNLEPNPELFNIQDVFRDKMSLVEQKIEKKRIVMIDESNRDFVYADKSMIEIVVQNLITNAVKFSRVGDVITVGNRAQNGSIILRVEDTGVGISEENLSKLFQNGTFTTTGTSNEKGTGLGLTICKELVELNGGRIWVESTRNVGSKFFVELPREQQSK